MSKATAVFTPEQLASMSLEDMKAMQALLAAQLKEKAEPAVTNMAIGVKGKFLTLKIDLTQDHGPSKSGKTNIIASTHGFYDLGDGVSMSVNITRKK